LIENIRSLIENDLDEIINIVMCSTNKDSNLITKLYELMYRVKNVSNKKGVERSLVRALESDFPLPHDMFYKIYKDKNLDFITKCIKSKRKLIVHSFYEDSICSMIHEKRIYEIFKIINFKESRGSALNNIDSYGTNKMGDEILLYLIRTLDDKFTGMIWKLFCYLQQESIINILLSGSTNNIHYEKCLSWFKQITNTEKSMCSIEIKFIKNNQVVIQKYKNNALWSFDKYTILSKTMKERIIKLMCCLKYYGLKVPKPILCIIINQIILFI
jgi:hypothetical protein